MKKTLSIGLAGLFATLASAVAAEPLMSPEWGEAACEAWNNNVTLTEELGGDTWAANDGGKGYKVMQVYRMDCNDAPTAELQISNQDGNAICTYGGAVKSSDLDKGVDYIMFAKTSNWERMGSGKDGAMKSMTFGRLKFVGPKMEAMSNMGPFGAFLLLTGDVEGSTTDCPTN
jgi:putative sterol carrier protein